MSLVDSLLGAIARLDGDALVMHVGEKPYVVTTSDSLDAFRGPLSWGQVELATKRLTVEAVSGMLQQLLPPDQRLALTEYGALEYELPPRPDVHGRFTVIAARGGDDIWLEIRYRRQRPEVTFEPALPSEAPAPAVAEAAPPAEAPEAVAPAPVEAPAPTVEPAPEVEPAPVVELAAAPEAPPAVAVVPVVEAPLVVEAAPVIEAAPAVEALPVAAAPPAVEAPPVAEARPVEAPPVVQVEHPLEIAAEIPPAAPFALEPPLVAAPEEGTIELVAEDLGGVEVELPFAAQPAAPVVSEAPALVASVRTLEIPAIAEAAAAVDRTVPADEEPVYDLSSVLAETAAEGSRLEAVPLEVAIEPPPAVVVPLARPTIRAETTPAPSVQRSTLDRLLRVAAARGASALYIVAESRPMLRVEGDIVTLEGEPELDVAEVSAILMDLAPEPTREALASGEVSEWISDVEGVGRVRCMSFRDHRGPGGIFRLLPARALTAEQLGLSPAIQALSGEPDGLVLVTGPRASGKSAIISAFVDLINRTRADHVITLETQIGVRHDSRRSFVSQRELRGTADELMAAARAALREDPDVLVFEDLRSPALLSVALEAAESGRLVFGALPAAGATAAVERVLDRFAPDRRAEVQTSLATTLRAVVAQVLLRKIGGGRLPARELLLNTRAVAALLVEGKTFQLPHAIDSGRKQGMTPLNDALVAAIRSAAVDPAEAYRKAYDRDGLIAQLRREGIDTSFVERLA